ncbi:MAG: ExeM/NucH family extracellular endonuclease [Phycisphaerales bacterium]|nr:ExeM/NucH family extracellular endonuclease [Phycisphaerales bacterium]
MLRNIVLSAIGFGVVSSAASAAIVINEGYGGGGNSGSVYTNDFIELYNNGLTSVDVSGYQVAYASATGTFTPSTTGVDTTAFHTVLPSGTTIAAGGFLLLQEAAGAASPAPLPSPFITDATPIAMSGTTFKLELLDASSLVLDLVGVGPTASAFEGTGPAPVIANATSSSRKVDGVDSNQNSLDFQTVTPTPGAANAVPEPASLALIGLGGLTMLRRRR